MPDPTKTMRRDEPTTRGTCFVSSEVEQVQYTSPTPCTRQPSRACGGQRTYEAANGKVKPSCSVLHTARVLTECNAMQCITHLLEDVSIRRVLQKPGELFVRTSLLETETATSQYRINGDTSIERRSTGSTNKREKHRSYYVALFFMLLPQMHGKRQP